MTHNHPDESVAPGSLRERSPGAGVSASGGLPAGGDGKARPSRPVVDVEQPADRPGWGAHSTQDAACVFRDEYVVPPDPGYGGAEWDEGRCPECGSGTLVAGVNGEAYRHCSYIKCDWGIRSDVVVTPAPAESKGATDGC